MKDAKTPFNRWLVVVGAILIQLCLGAIYSWSVFTNMLTLPIEDGGYGFSATQTAWVFSAGLMTFAIVMIAAGRLQKAVGPRPISMAGGIVLGAGYIMGGFWGNTFLGQLFFIGIVGGAGIGLAYVVPIAVGIKWFPDKKGMITGLAVAGFGFGATLWVKMAGSWFGGLINTTNLFGLPGVQSVFVIYGAVFLILVVLGSAVMVNPPRGYAPPGWNPDEASGGNALGNIDMTSRRMLKKPQFYMLWSMFFLCASAGLMVIYCISLFGVDALQATGAIPDPNEAAIVAGTAMAWYAILNGLGRIVWGSVSDRIGRKNSLTAMCILQGIMMLSFYHVGGYYWGLIIGASIIGFNFGGNFALFPSATADYFGNKNVGTNYGWIFLSYGIAGIAGPQIAGYFKDAAAGQVDAWLFPFIIAGLGCLLAGAISLMLKPVKN